MPFPKKKDTTSAPLIPEAIAPTATPPLDVDTPQAAVIDSPPLAAAPAPRQDQTVVVTANVDQVASSMRRMSSGGIPKMEDIAFNSLDEASRGVPQALLKIGKERGIAFYRLGWEGIQEHPLITSGIAVPMSVDNFPECEPFVAADGLVHMRDTVVCVARHDVAIKKIREPQLARAAAYNTTILNPDVMRSEINNQVVEGRVEKTMEITPAR